jgi:hypothetical protein
MIELRLIQRGLMGKPVIRGTRLTVELIFWVTSAEEASEGNDRLECFSRFKDV